MGIFGLSAGSIIAAGPRKVTQDAVTDFSGQSRRRCTVLAYIELDDLSPRTCFS